MTEHAIAVTEVSLLLSWAVLGGLYKHRLGRRTVGASAPVSRNKTGRQANRQTGPAWEQDKPFPECFETDREIGDDL